MERRRREPTQPDPLERVTSRDGSDAIEKLAPAGVFGYAAGKSIIAKRLVKLFPEHKAYGEEFCGSAAMFFTKEESPRELLNDIDADVIHAFKMIKRISKGDLAALAAKKWVGAKETFEKLRGSSPSNDLERLYRTLYLINFSYGKGRKSFNPSVAGMNSGMAKRIEKFQPRLKNTTILCGDYEKAIKEIDGKDAFHFIDPPYAGYKAGGGGVGEKDFDESRFRKILEGIKGRFLVTYGVKGKLDTSGFEVKRMKQPRTIRFMRGASQDKFLTHLLISNFKVAKKSLGAGIELDDVVGVIDTDDQGNRLFVSGSRTSVSVPEQIVSPRTWKHEDPLLSYPEEPAAVEARAQLRFLEKRCEMDLSFDVAGETVAWSFDVQRADVVGDPRAVAKSFSVDGSRYFLAMSDGVAAREMDEENIATSVVKIDRPHVELGLQTVDAHEYFLSKGDELTGVLHLERDLAAPLGAQYPWLATYVDRYPQALYNFAVLKAGAPMPPAGVSALPASLERYVPVEMRYWDLRGTEAIKARDALISSQLLAPENIAVVDGELLRVLHKIELDETPARIDASADWYVRKIEEIVPRGARIMEVFSPGRDALAKAEDAIVYCDAGEAVDGAIDLLAKSLAEREHHYVVSAVDSPEARASLVKMGRPFRFRPGGDVGVDAAKRLFVASFPVRHAVDWIDKGLPQVMRMLASVGPPIEWSGAVANILGKDNRDKLKAAWEGLSPQDKRRVQDAFDGKFEKAERKPRLYSGQSDDAADVGKWLSSEQVAAKMLAEAYAVKKQIKQEDDGWHVYSDAGDKHLGGPYKDKSQAIDRLRQVEGHKSARKDDLAESGFGEGGFLMPAQGNPYRRRERQKLLLSLVTKDGGADEQIVYGIVLEPETVDAQQDVYSPEEVRAAAHKYMEDFQNTGLMHRRKINEKAKVIENYLAPCDFDLGGQKVKKGTWVMAMRVSDAELWDAVKKGELTGFSIGGSAQRVPETTAKAMRKIEHQGIPITIDRPKGYVQTGRDAQGQEWKREYKVDYGFIPRTKGGDGDGVDVFIGPEKDAPTTYWIAQRKDDRSFDEYKVMVGYPSAAAAKKSYLEHVPAKYFGELFEVPVEQVKALLNREPDHKLS